MWEFFSPRMFFKCQIKTTTRTMMTRNVREMAL